MSNNELRKRLVDIKNQLSLKNIITIDCYLFGSVLKDLKKANDIDILVIYKFHKQLSIIKKEFEELNHEIPLDISYFTFSEEEELNFVKLQKAQLLFSL